jgi:hypothetical protein
VLPEKGRFLSCKDVHTVLLFLLLLN